MKIKEGFVLRNVMGNNVVVAVGEASRNFHGMIQLNATAAEIWGYIEKGYSRNEICEKMLERYEVSREKLVEDVDATISLLLANGFAEE